MTSPQVPHGMHFMPCVTLSFVCLSRNTCNFDLLEIRRNSTMYLDFARRTQRYVPHRHPRSREIPRFATCVYHFTLSGVSHITRSTMEYEFIALDKCGEEAECLHHFLEDMPRWPKSVPPICIHCDSQSAIGKA